MKLLPTIALPATTAPGTAATKPAVASPGAKPTSAVLDPPTAGMVNIKLPAATTAAFAPGRCTEALRIKRAGRTSTFQGLSIMVVARNPFAR